MKSMMSILLTAIAAYAGVVALVFFFQRSLLYHPSSGQLEPAQYGETRMAAVKVVTEDGLPLVSW